MPLVAFPYTLHQGYAMPMIPITILAHKIWAFVDSGAIYTLLRVDEAHRLGIDWARGRRQMIVVGDGSFIPTYIHDLAIHRQGNVKNMHTITIDLTPETYKQLEAYA